MKILIFQINANFILGTFTEQQQGEITFREISTPILEKVSKYFYFKLRYTNSSSEIPEFPIEPEIALELVNFIFFFLFFKFNLLL